MAATEIADYFPGASVLPAGSAPTEAGVFIPLSSLDISNVNGNDIRKFAFAFCRETFNRLKILQGTDRPTRFSLARNTPIGINESTVRQSYTVNFDLDLTSAALSPEPVVEDLPG